MQGFLNLHKPAGWTSHDCVAKVRRLLHLKQVGHAGTLDPAATGVLPIAVGRATRLLQFLRQDKAYRATVRLGVQTSTDDLEGEVLATQNASGLTLETVTAGLQQFQGTLQQIPPAYSAIQVQGKRLYELARSGKSVEVQPRTVEVFKIAILDWRSGEFPEIDLAIACGPGTYIRSIARDLGDFLEVGGTLASLIRTYSSGFNLLESLTLEELAAQQEASTFTPILPETALAHLPVVALPPDLAKRWCQGQKLPLEPEVEGVQGPLRIHDTSGQFLGVGSYKVLEERSLLVPQMVFVPA